LTNSMMTSIRFWGCDMQILFNELSLTGQFSDQNAFIRDGLLPFVGVLKEMQGFSTLLLKKSDAWDKMITPTSTLYALLVDNALRTFDEVRRLKSAIVSLTKEPFWDSDSKQNHDSTYFLNGADIWGTSPAEASERDKVVVSFVSSSASADPLDIIRNGVNVPLTNLTCSGKLTELLWANNQISFELYLKASFSGGKLNFSMVDQKMDFSTIQSGEQPIFIDKFRTSEKFRCHGYREKDSFVVIGFETDHKLSDKG